MAASNRGDLVKVEAYVDAGANLDLTNKNGTTALMMASMSGHASVARALLEGGAAVDSANKDGVTALMMASKWGKAEALRVLLEAGADRFAVATGGPSRGKSGLAVATAESVAVFNEFI